MTGAVASVNIKESLGDRPITNVSAALQGVVPGLKIESTTGTPGDDMTYNIRGTTSINGGEPLVLVNNVPMDINMIDPQDIESVSILKDAASAAIYGARAGTFGVILITTKQGKKDMAPRFNYNNNFSFSKASELPQKASPLESVLAYKEMGWANDTYVDGKNITQWEGYIRDYQANPSNYPNGYIFDDQGNLFLMRENDMFADMMDNFGFMQNHSFSVSGGSQRTSYRLSLGYTGEDGILVTDKDKFDRINMSSLPECRRKQVANYPTGYQICKLYPEQGGARRTKRCLGKCHAPAVLPQHPAVRTRRHRISCRNVRYFRTLRRTEGDQEDQPAYFGTCHHLSAERTENNR